MGGGWLVAAKTKDHQGLMKDRVRERKRDGIQSILLDLVGNRDMEGYLNIKLGDICIVEL